MACIIPLWPVNTSVAGIYLCGRYIPTLWQVYQGSHRLEKYLKMKGCLEKYLKTKVALKSAGKLAIGLEKHLNFTSSGIPDNKIRF